MTKFPTEGGSYIRDPVTGALIRQPDDTAPAPAPVPAPDTGDPIPATTDPKRKGGK